MLRKDYGAGHFPLFKILKEEYRGYFIEDWNLFEVYCLVKLEIIKTGIHIGFSLLENEELILLLLIHYQILSTDNSEPFFAL
jgi:hypothetical protein